MLRRKLAKSISYRIFAFSIGQTITWLLFHRIEINFVVALVDAVQTIGYFFYELLWDRIAE
jgi:uncharacterized membrane protein